MFFAVHRTHKRNTTLPEVYSCLVSTFFLFAGAENFFDAGNVIDLAGTDLISFDNILFAVFGYRGDPGGLPRKPVEK